MPLGILVSETFRYYHLLHHAHQGDARLDVDLPTQLEARLLQRKLGRLLWLATRAFAYTTRPLLVHPKKPSRPEILQFGVQLAFNVAIVLLWGPKALAYLPVSSLLGMGLHPIAGHYVTEHHPFRDGAAHLFVLRPVEPHQLQHRLPQRTPRFCVHPGSRLAEARRLAPEFYEHLLHHDSRTRTLWRFLASGSRS